MSRGAALRAEVRFRHLLRRPDRSPSQRPEFVPAGHRAGDPPPDLCSLYDWGEVRIPQLALLQTLVALSIG
jgi:hypothetical protein